jgi:hypothetical protein
MTILAPIQQHIDALADPGFPAAAVAACVARPEASAPVLRALLQRAARGTRLSDAEAAQLFLGLHILAKLRDRQSFLPLLRLVCRPYDELEDLLGDALTETLAKIVASLFDGDAEALFEIIVDVALDEVVRESFWRAAAWLTFAGAIDRARMRAFILRYDAERLAPKGDLAWIGWLDAIAHLGFEDVARGIGAVWIDQRLPPEVKERRHFDADLAAALRAPEDAERFARAGMGTIDDITADLAWVAWDGPPAPIVNPLRDVGRNDPCPCGSGRKAKKCCLAAG